MSPTNKYLLIILILLLTFYGNQAEAQTASRLIGTAAFRMQSGNYAFIDTAYYRYSSGRGSILVSSITIGDDLPLIKLLKAGKLDYNTLISYDTFYHGFYGQIILRSFRTYDYNNSILTEWTQLIDSSGKWKDYSRTLNLNYQNNYSEQIAQRWIDSIATWINETRNTYISNNNGRMLTTISQTWSGNNLAWQNVSRSNLSWDGAGNPVMLIGSNWVDTSGAWQETVMFNYHYSGTGNMDSCLVMQKFNSSSSWSPGSNKYYIYSNNDPVKFKTGYTLNTPNQIDSSIFDANHNRVLTYERKRFMGATANYSKTQITYGGFNEPLTQLISFWDSTTTSYRDSFLYVYYYETYSPAAVRGLIKNTADLIIFPSPAQDNIHIRIKWSRPEPFTATICDMQGKSFLYWKEAAALSYEKTISTSALSAGQYILTLFTASDKLSQQFTIIK